MALDIGSKVMAILSFDGTSVHKASLFFSIITFYIPIDREFQELSNGYTYSVDVNLRSQDKTLRARM